jgi:tetratricopeptide (TPR) repeat protein
VFLNACHVGRTGSGTGQPRSAARVNELAANLALQLMHNGVKAVVAAGWAVDDRAAQAFAGELYDQLLEGQRYGAAVHEARKQAFDGGRTNTWGAYQCYGDPGFSLGATASTVKVPTPVSARELVRRLDVLSSQASDGAALDQLRKVHESVDDLARLEVLRFPNVEVYEALGRAYGELGCYADAVWAYRQANQVDQGRGSVLPVTLEQLANLEVRLATNRALKRPTLFRPGHSIDESPSELFDQAEARLQRLMAFEETPERRSLRGSLYRKRAAATTTAGRTRDRRVAAARDEYWLAIVTELRNEPKLSPYATCVWAQMSALADGQSPLGLERALVDMLERQLVLKKAGRDLRAPLTEHALRQLADAADDDAATLAAADLEQVVKRELRDKANEPDGAAGPGPRGPAIDFWTDAALGDVGVTKAVLGPDRSVKQSLESAKQHYQLAFDNRSAIRNRDSVLDHLRDLGRLLPKERADAIGQLVQDLEQFPGASG